MTDREVLSREPRISDGRLAQIAADGHRRYDHTLYCDVPLEVLLAWDLESERLARKAAEERATEAQQIAASEMELAELWEARCARLREALMLLYYDGGKLVGYPSEALVKRLLGEGVGAGAAVPAGHGAGEMSAAVKGAGSGERSAVGGDPPQAAEPVNPAGVESQKQPMTVDAALADAVVEAAHAAVEALNRYADADWSDAMERAVPNEAMSARDDLRDALAALDAARQVKPMEGE